MLVCSERGGEIRPQIYFSPQGVLLHSGVFLGFEDFLGAPSLACFLIKTFKVQKNVPSVNQFSHWELENGH